MDGDPVDARVRFRGIEWQTVAPGAREKVDVVGDRRLRLLELTDAFEEGGWCHKAHWGIVLEGEMTLELPSGSARLAEGDGLALPADDEHRHEASVPPGGRVLLFLVEPVRRKNVYASANQ